MSMRRNGDGVEFRSERDRDSGPSAGFKATYAPRGEAFNAVPESLDWKLIERYCAYTVDEKGRILRVQVHHRPWELRRATLHIDENTMTAPFGIELEGEPLLHFAPRQDMVIWPHEVAAGGEA
jgi:uncharacterized protein YqjF (DUF2071 family)